VTAHKVTRVTRQPQGFLVETQDPHGRSMEFAGQKLISTIPLPELIDLLSPAPPPEVREAAGHLKFRSLRFLNLMLDIPEVSRNTWLYVPEEKFIFFRLQEFTKWCPRNSPRGKVSFSLELSCEKGDDIWTMPEGELLHTCLRDLKKMGLDLKGKVLGSFSTFAEHAYPFYSLGYKRHVQKIYRFIDEFDHLLVTGRQGLFRYINMDKAIETGFQAAGALYDAQKKRQFLREKEESKYLEADLYLKKR